MSAPTAYLVIPIGDMASHATREEIEELQRILSPMVTYVVDDPGTVEAMNANFLARAIAIWEARNA